jgi:ankyrin repeat protein
MSNPELKLKTPLHIAAYNCDFETLVDLLQSGADPNARDNAGFTPLHWCAFRGLVGTDQHLIAKALLRAGADQTRVLVQEIAYCAGQLNRAIRR